MTDDKKREILAQVGRVNSDICYGCPIIERYLELMSSQPELVRCKDCKHARRMCQPWNDLVCEKNGQTNKPYLFCADGER